MLHNVDWAWILSNCIASLRRVAVGVCAATLVGVALGLARSALPAAVKKNFFFNLLVEAPKFPPPIAWIPFVILLFGIGEIPAYIIVFIGALAPIFLSSYEAAESVPFQIRDTAKSLELRGLSRFTHVLFPASLPQILTGVRAGLSMGWMSVIASELVSGQSGLGYSIQLNRLNLQYGLMAIDITLIGIIGFLLYELMNLMERLLIPWHERVRIRRER